LRRSYRARIPLGVCADRTATAGDIVAYALQQLINGLTLGAIYGLIAIGYTMVYGIIGMINFAHGDVFMIGAFIAVIAFTLLTMAA
jgi:branched-chain amino acid transport system permease protein